MHRRKGPSRFLVHPAQWIRKLLIKKVDPKQTHRATEGSMCVARVAPRGVARVTPPGVAHVTPPGVVVVRLVGSMAPLKKD
jgi:hypothetical protein